MKTLNYCEVCTNKENCKTQKPTIKCGYSTEVAETISDVKFLYECKRIKELRPVRDVISKLTPKKNEYNGVSHSQLVNIRLSQHENVEEGVEHFKEAFPHHCQQVRVCTDCIALGICGHVRPELNIDGCFRFTLNDGSPVMIADFKLCDGILVWINSMVK